MNIIDPSSQTQVSSVPMKPISVNPAPVIQPSVSSTVVAEQREQLDERSRSPTDFQRSPSYKDTRVSPVSVVDKPLTAAVGLPPLMDDVSPTVVSKVVVAERAESPNSPRSDGRDSKVVPSSTTDKPELRDSMAVEPPSLIEPSVATAAGEQDQLKRSESHSLKRSSPGTKMSSSSNERETVQPVVVKPPSVIEDSPIAVKAAAVEDNQLKKRSLELPRSPSDGKGSKLPHSSVKRGPVGSMDVEPPSLVEDHQLKPSPKLQRCPSSKVFRSPAERETLRSVVVKPRPLIVAPPVVSNAAGNQLKRPRSPNLQRSPMKDSKMCRSSSKREPIVYGEPPSLIEASPVVSKTAIEANQLKYSPYLRRSPAGSTMSSLIEELEGEPVLADLFNSFDLDDEQVTELLSVPNPEDFPVDIGNILGCDSPAAVKEEGAMNMSLKSATPYAKSPNGRDYQSDLMAETAMNKFLRCDFKIDFNSPPTKPKRISASARKMKQVLKHRNKQDIELELKVMAAGTLVSKLSRISSLPVFENQNWLTCRLVQFVDFREIFQKMGKPTTVTLAYHYTDNLKSLDQESLGEFGAGLYATSHPSDHETGKLAVLVAIFKGKTIRVGADGTIPRGSGDINCVVGNKNLDDWATTDVHLPLYDDVMVIKTTPCQCLPLFVVPKGYSDLDALLEKLQTLLKEFFEEEDEESLPAPLQSPTVDTDGVYDMED